MLINPSITFVAPPPTQTSTLPPPTPQIRDDCNGRNTLTAVHAVNTLALIKECMCCTAGRTAGAVMGSNHTLIQEICSGFLASNVDH